MVVLEKIPRRIAWKAKRLNELTLKRFIGKMLNIMIGVLIQFLQARFDVRGQRARCERTRRGHARRALSSGLPRIEHGIDPLQCLGDVESDIGDGITGECDNGWQHHSLSDFLTAHFSQDLSESRQWKCKKDLATRSTHVDGEETGHSVEIVLIACQLHHFG